jgi:DNA-binding SARP family transcriptional activator
MFYYWALQVINANDTPLIWFFMKRLIVFFKLFKTKSIGQKELMNLFWADEDTELAKAHIRTYQNEINELSKKYNDFDTESTYEQHMAERRRI